MSEAILIGAVVLAVIGLWVMHRVLGHVTQFKESRRELDVDDKFEDLKHD